MAPSVKGQPLISTTIQDTTCVNSHFRDLVGSPTPGLSTLTTSAPAICSSLPQAGPAMCQASSKTFMPASGGFMGATPNPRFWRPSQNSALPGSRLTAASLGRAAR